MHTTYTRCRSARHWSHTRYSLRGFAAGAQLSAGGRRRKWKGERLEKGKHRGVPLADRASQSSSRTPSRRFFFLLFQERKKFDRSRSRLSVFGLFYFRYKNVSVKSFSNILKDSRNFKQRKIENLKTMIFANQNIRTNSAIIEL